MRPDWIKIVIGTIIIGMLSWWLWTMGEQELQSWLLSCVGGFLMELGMIGGIGMKYEYPRSGIQVKMMMLAATTVIFVSCCIFSFFQFEVPTFVCVNVLIFLLFLLSAIKIYRSKM